MLHIELCHRAGAFCPARGRRVIVRVAAAGGLASILLWGAKGSRALKLPITVGPLKGGEKVRAHPAACSHTHCAAAESGMLAALLRCVSVYTDKC